MNNQPTPNQPTPSQTTYNTSWAPSVIGFVLLLAGLCTYGICKVTNYDTNVTNTVFAVVTIMIIISSATNSAHVNANVPIDQRGNPILRLLQYWLIPSLLGLFLLSIMLSVRVLYGHHQVPSNTVIYMALYFFFMWTAIGQLVGRIYSGRAHDAVLTVVGLVVLTWVSYALGSLWSTQKHVMLVVPDLITAFTSRRLIAISDGNLDPFYAATVIMTTLVCLGLSLRSYLAPKSEVITPFGGLVFMALLTTVLVAVDATIYSAHLDEYPCGLEWGEWLLRQIIASQIPLLFASMVYGLSTTSSLHTWINSRRTALMRIWCTPIWAVIHCLIWLMLVIPFHNRQKHCMQVDHLSVIMPICVSLLIVTITMVYQALRLKYDTNPLFYFAVITTILTVPILPAAETARWPYRPIIDAVLTSSMNHKMSFSTYPAALAIICACSIIVLLATLGICGKRQHNHHN